MKEKIYYEQSSDRTLVLDSLVGFVDWEIGEKSFPQLQIKDLQKLIEDKGQSFLKALPQDILISTIERYSKLSIKENNGQSFLFMLNRNIGEIKNQILHEDFDSLHRYGGLIITLLDEKEKKIIFMMPNVKKYEKTSKNVRSNIIKSNVISSSRNSYSNATNNEEYIEAKISLPKNMFNNNPEVLELAMKNNDMLIELSRDMNSKLNYLNNSINNLLEDNQMKLVMSEKDNMIEELNFQLEKLIRDRKIMDNERKKAELIALNQIKSELKLSAIAIEKQIDLEETTTLKDKFKALLGEVLDSVEINLEEKKRIMDNEDFNYKLEALSDNFDSKVQSLKDIKSDFIKNNIISPKGD
ncbi:hypothetical protein AT278_04745 [Bacillus cereus]|uniref:hypothetical protein n=1 Tax=Bacillus TaxID=1386 RepID=UPI00077A8C88|nr:hypothetical protein [Bacillus cereus]KXY54625.1 hypothetical protein AT278_04745 [Bacillus cereus]